MMEASDKIYPIMTVKECNVIEMIKGRAI